ncbi:hypothetical protein PhaeoP97_03561 (plasmid) [Phaeobacter porticola]|uniref:Uncharacterized protein n=1 Tax=Phaeobacter porticola TaxID=1844006 RepID=A0A1L3IA45_9RHOB|nr:hypothetical protein PhaeoP97_03561 [Phaeobacter porticola]
MAAMRDYNLKCPCGDIYCDMVCRRVIPVGTLGDVLCRRALAAYWTGLNCLGNFAKKQPSKTVLEFALNCMNGALMRDN